MRYLLLTTMTVWAGQAFGFSAKVYPIQVGYFPFLFGAHPDSTHDPTTVGTNMDWDLYREMWGSDGDINGNLKSVEYLDRLVSLTVATLIIAGDHDECDPVLAREMQQKITGSKLVILPTLVTWLSKTGPSSGSSKSVISLIMTAHMKNKRRGPAA